MDPGQQTLALCLIRQLSKLAVLRAALGARRFEWPGHDPNGERWQRAGPQLRFPGRKTAAGNPQSDRLNRIERAANLFPTAARGLVQREARSVPRLAIHQSGSDVLPERPLDRLSV